MGGNQSRPKGLSQPQIQTLGSWSSESFKSYIVQIAPSLKKPIWPSPHKSCSASPHPYSTTPLTGACSPFVSPLQRNKQYRRSDCPHWGQCFHSTPNTHSIRPTLLSAQRTRETHYLDYYNSYNLLTNILSFLCLSWNVIAIYENADEGYRRRTPTKNMCDY